MQSEERQEGRKSWSPLPETGSSQEWLRSNLHLLKPYRRKVYGVEAQHKVDNNNNTKNNDVLYSGRAAGFFGLCFKSEEGCLETGYLPARTYAAAGASDILQVCGSAPVASSLL